jgi:putative hydrolase of the HAD superfamily
MSLDDLVRDLEGLSLDAGNTIVFFDPEAASDAARRAGFALAPERLDRADAEAKHRLELGPPALAPPLDDPDLPRSWTAFVRTLVEIAAGFDREQSAACVRALWRAHREFNLWRRVPNGLIESVQAVRAAGVRVCVVSNSEGHLELLFRRLGIADAFDRIVDSHVVGVEKPDPAIFAHALGPLRLDPGRTLHLGDVYATDVVGARAAGLRAALIDPNDHYAGRHADVPRVRDVATVARALVEQRRRAD